MGYWDYSMKKKENVEKAKWTFGANTQSRSVIGKVIKETRVKKDMNLYEEDGVRWKSTRKQW